MSASVVDLGGEYTSVQSVEAESVVGDVNGAVLDCRDCHEHVTCIVNAGEFDGVTTLDVKLQESADGSTSWTDISGATMTQIGAGGHSHEMKTLKGRAKRYVRAVADFAGSSVTADLCVVLMARKMSY